MNLDPKFWKVTIWEHTLGGDITTELTNVFFHEENHANAREYVIRMQKCADNFEHKNKYSWTIDAPVLVDELDVTEYNGEEFLDSIRKEQDELGVTIP
jgi:hypothetical protein